MKCTKWPNIALANPVVLQFRKFHPAALSDTPGMDPFYRFFINLLFWAKSRKKFNPALRGCVCNIVTSGGRDPPGALQLTGV